MLEQDKAKASVWFWDRGDRLDSMPETGPLLQLRPTALRVDSFLTGLSWKLFRGTSVSISETSTKTALGKTSVFVKHTILSELVPAHGQRSSSGRFCKDPEWSWRGISPSFFTQKRFSRDGWCFRTAFMYLPQVLLKELIVFVQQAEMCEKILIYFNIFVLCFLFVLIDCFWCLPSRNKSFVLLLYINC